MEMFALIKNVKDVKVIKGSDIENITNNRIKINVCNYLDNIASLHGENYKLSLNDFDELKNRSKFNEFTVDYVLKSLIEKKKKNEIKRILNDLFDEYDLDKELIKYVYRNFTIYDSFYTDRNSKVLYNKYYVSNLFKKLFGQLIGEDLISELDKLISCFEYNIDYNVLEFKNYILSINELVKVDRKNFETLLYLFGEISDPKKPASIHHKCYNCENLSPLLCEKAEINKKRIDNYPFINEGYQVYMTTNYRDLMMTSFIVEECSDYKPSNDNYIDEEEYAYVKRMRK